MVLAITFNSCTSAGVSTACRIDCSVNLSAIKPGAKMNFTLDKGSDGMPVIDTMAPAGGGK